MKTIAPLLVLTPLLVGAGSASPADILSKMDEAINRADDQFLEYEMIDRKDGRERTLRLDVSLKGDRRLTEFTAPADLRGTKVLIVSSTQMYVYLPAYKKVRRIASHVTAQGFMGTTYSNDDLALIRFSDKYTATIEAENDESWTLALTARPDAGAPYPRIRLTVEKARHMPLVLEYLDTDRKKLKTETRSAYTCDKGVCAPAELEMVDHSDGDHSSTLVRKAWRVNSGLSDRLFTKRNLARAR